MLSALFSSNICLLCRKTGQILHPMSFIHARPRYHPGYGQYQTPAPNTQHPTDHLCSHSSLVWTSRKHLRTVVRRLSRPLTQLFSACKLLFRPRASWRMVHVKFKITGQGGKTGVRLCLPGCSDVMSRWMSVGVLAAFIYSFFVAPSLSGAPPGGLLCLCGRGQGSCRRCQALGHIG